MQGLKISWFYPDFQGLESSFGPFKLVIGDAHRAPNISVTIGVKRFCPGFEVLKPILLGLGGQKDNSNHLNFLLFRGYAGQVSRFGPPKTCRFPGLEPPNVQVSRFGPPKMCRFPGLDPPKRAGFQAWISQNVQVSRFGPPKTCRFPGLSPLKRAGFQVWTPKTCRFPGLDPTNRARL